MRDVAMLEELRAQDVSAAGAKAANLGELISAGVPVPTGFCVLNSVYDGLVAPGLATGVEQLAALLEDGDALESAARSLRQAIETVRLSPALLAQLEERFRVVCADGQAVAVRSSGTSEDTAATSFAGQYHTELAVRSFDDMVSAVKHCWASLWTVYAIRYRQSRSIPHTAASMAVIVQRMAAPVDAAGVMFTAGLSEEHVTVESSWGLGEAVVSGLVTPDRFSVARADLRVRNAEVARKGRMVVVSDTGGTSVVDVPDDRQTTASLTAAQASELAGHGLVIEKHFGCPQDVEWVLRDGRVAILQARPLTTEDPRAAVTWESPIEGAGWARISICDSWLPEPLSPLFASTLFPCLVKRWLENWAGPESEQLRNPLLPKPMTGTIHGFAYLRLDYPMNKHPLRTIKLSLNTYRFHFALLGKRWRTVILPRHVDRLGAMRELDLTKLGDDELLDMIDEAQDLSARYWAILGGLAWYWNGGEWVLDRLYPRLTAPAARAGREIPSYSTLLQGYQTRTAETDFALYDLARSGGDGDAAKRGAKPFEDVLARYGHQVYQLDFVEPTPAEDPSTFLTAIEAYRAGQLPDPRERLRNLAKRREEAQSELFSTLRGFPVRRMALRSLLRWNRRYAKVRDQALFYFTLGWPTIRRAYLELGRRLVAAGVLNTDEDVFYLTCDELLAELRSPGPGGRDDVVRQRRALREEQKLLSPPPKVPESMRLFLGRLDVTAVALLGQQAKPRSGSGLSGSPVSPGRVTARARHIASARDFGKLQAGDVLVTSFITPAWSPLLAIAGGVVTDTGGTLSHGSIVAREFGIPAVMGTNNATKRIQDGQLVTVDGDRGLVY